MNQAMNLRQRVSVCTVKQRLLQYLDPQREHVYLGQGEACCSHHSRREVLARIGGSR